ncbi:MAG TPA: sterol carrier protein domain-containing protein [Planctomycetota bacterium]
MAGRRAAHGPPQGAAEEQRLAWIQGQSFGHGVETIAPWWEIAGHLFEYRVDLDRLPLRDRDLSVRPITDADAPAIEACYRSVARRNHGYPDRNHYLRTRVRNPRLGAATGFLVEADGAVEGYLYMVAVHDQKGYQHRLHLTDFQAATARAGRRLFALLADHARMASTARWQGGPNDPIVELLPEFLYEMNVVEQWMLRILDVPRAFEARGWPAGVTAESQLEIEDPDIAENHGRFVLAVADGAAEVSPGGAGHLRMHVRDLAPLYTGYHPPATLAAMDRLQGPDSALATAATVFAAPCPAMADMF